MKTSLALFLALFSLGPSAFAQKASTQAEADAIISSLQFREGQIVLGQNLATVNLPPGLRYLSGADANKVLVNLWGNPPSDEPLGMFLSANVSPIDRGSWAVVISFVDDGYVKDADAEKIDYTKLLAEMQKGIRDGNKERINQGYQPIQLIGWAAPPRYDRVAKKLYWAKELTFGNEPEHSLNYNIRILGRRGVLVLNAVAGIEQLPEVEQATPEILAAVDFNPGERYADFNPNRGDKVASYGIGALIAGGVAAKLGLFKGLWIAALAAKKFIIIGVIAISGWIVRTFKKITKV